MNTNKPTLDDSASTLALTEKVVQILTPLFQGEVNELAKVTTVERHKKRFDKISDIKREVTGTGCIRITATTVNDLQRYGGCTVGTVKFVAFVMTNDQFGKNRDQRAELIANRLALAVTQPSFSQQVAAYKQVERASFQNLSTVEFDAIGVAMWAVEWSQQCTFNTPINIDLLPDFLGVHSVDEDGEPLNKFAYLDLTVNTTNAEIDEQGNSDTPQMKGHIQHESNLHKSIQHEPNLLNPEDN